MTSTVALPPPSSGWRVTAQTETSDIGPDGRITSGYRVSFTTNNGHSGSVFAPMTSYSVEKVRAQIEGAAARLDAVGSLTSEG